jgi:hypothetical protein
MRAQAWGIWRYMAAIAFIICYSITILAISVGCLFFALGVDNYKKRHFRSSSLVLALFFSAPLNAVVSLYVVGFLTAVFNQHGYIDFDITSLYKLIGVIIIGLLLASFNVVGFGTPMFWEIGPDVNTLPESSIAFILFLSATFFYLKFVYKREERKQKDFKFSSL